MLIKSPNFWTEKNNISLLMMPLSGLYFLFYKLYQKISNERVLQTPVICVGNAVIGGSGKTPICIKIREILNKNYKNIFVLTRGYLGREKGPLIVNRKHTFKCVGDESIIHMQYGKTCMSKDRFYGGKLCNENNCDLIIMDDGFQSKNIKKDISILVIDNNYGFGNERIFPAGPLREPSNESINRADAIIIIGEKFNKKFNFKDKIVFYAKKEIQLKKNINKEIYAFSGLGNNLNFFNSLKKKFILKYTKSFPDHYIYKESDLEKIYTLSKEKKLSMVCTLKDFVKIPHKYKKNVNVANLKIKLENEDEFFKFLVSRLKKTRIY